LTPRAYVEDMFRSLRVRNYRLFTVAQLVSLSGTWMQAVAQNWLVLDLTGSGVALGIVTGLQFLPTALAGMWGGLIADRYDKRKILVWTQSLSGSLAVVLGVLTLTGSVRLWMVYLLALLLGMVTAADTPARQAFVIEMVGPEDVANAIGLNSAVFNGGRIAGPAIGAVVIASFGLGVAFLLNGLTYLGPVAALLAMDRRALHPTERASRRPGMLREGLRYVWQTPRVRGTLLLLSIVATAGFNFTVTIPLLARYTFGGQVDSYALLTALAAGGGLLGGLWVARRARPTPRLLAGSGIAFGASTVGAAFAPTLLSAAMVLTLAGASAMAFIATANSTLQLSAPAHMRGRVMAIYALVFLGSTPVGGPIMGWISHEWGARVGIGVGGVVSFVAAIVALAVIHARAEREPAVGVLAPSLALTGSAPSPARSLDEKAN